MRPLQAQDRSRLKDDHLTSALGIGHGLVATYLRRPSTTVIAAVRDPHHPTSRALSALPTGADSQLIVIQIDSKSTTDPTTAMATLRSTHAITHLDTVIANAGIAADYSPVATVSLAAVSEHMTVNGIGPLLLFQAVLPLLQKAKNGPGKFVGVGSATGSIGGMERVPVPVAAYGPSKAVLHWLVRKIHLEHEALVSFVMNPGYVSLFLERERESGGWRGDR